MLVEVFKISSRFAAQVSRDPLGRTTLALIPDFTRKFEPHESLGETSK